LISIAKALADPAVVIRCEERKAMIRELPPNHGTSDWAVPDVLDRRIDYKSVNR